MTSQCYIMNVNRMASQNNQGKEKVMAYEEKSVGSTSFFKCEACPYMALAEDDIKFHLFTVHPDLAKTNGLADNIQIPCPGCTSVFDAEETLRTHLRNHHKMGIRDVKKMIKSLVQIALKNAMLKKEEPRNDHSKEMNAVQNMDDIKVPEVIGILPNTTSNSALPKGVAFITLDQFQNMSAPNYEKVDPKEIIQEASINILYANEGAPQYVNVSNQPTQTMNNIIQVPNVTPDLISSIQPRQTTVKSANMAISLPPENCQSSPHSLSQQPKSSRAGNCAGTVSRRKKYVEDVKCLGEPCSISGCNVRLKSEDKLLYHRKCHHNDRFYCPECSTVFACVGPLHTHLWKTHNIDMEMPTCDICGFKTFKRTRLYNVHMKTHGTERAYTCTVCQKTFKSSNHLGKHRTIHKTDGYMKCNVCQRKFQTESKLRAHVAAVHDKLRPFKCAECNFTTARKDDMKLHLRIHTGDKPYSCDQCDYCCGDHNAMRRHKLRHTKETPYRCKYCPYTSIQSTQFTTHMVTKHPNISEYNIFRCPYCPHKSVNKDKYINHLSSHGDQEETKMKIETSKGKPIWTIPSGLAETNIATEPSHPHQQDNEDSEAACKENVRNIPIGYNDYDGQQVNINTNDNQMDASYIEKDADIAKEDNNSDCLISESSNDTISDRSQYTPQMSMPSISYETPTSSIHDYMATSVSLGQNLLNCATINCLASNNIQLNNNRRNNMMTNFPLILPKVPQISVRKNTTLKPIDKIPLPVSRGNNPFMKSTLILPVPSNSNSPISTGNEMEIFPRKESKISVKSNLILKGPDQVNMFHSQQKMAFKQLENNERFGLGGPVTFNNLITTQFMTIAPTPVPSESPNNIMPYPQEALLKSATTPIDNGLTDNTQMFNFNSPINVNSLDLLPQQQKSQTGGQNYIKIEGTIKQNTQSPSLETMCSANALINNQAIRREYKASPPLEDIKKNINDIKKEAITETFYNIPINNPAPDALLVDQYLLENMGEQYIGQLDLSNIVLPESDVEDQQNDVIEIDDNSDDNKMLPRFDMNFPPLEPLYLINNDFHFLESDLSTQCSNSAVDEEPALDMNRVAVEPMNQNKPNSSETCNMEYSNMIGGQQDPMMNTTIKYTTNKINVKNIELMKN